MPVKYANDSDNALSNQYFNIFLAAAIGFVLYTSFFKKGGNKGGLGNKGTTSKPKDGSSGGFMGGGGGLGDIFNKGKANV